MPSTNSFRVVFPALIALKGSSHGKGSRTPKHVRRLSPTRRRTKFSFRSVLREIRKLKHAQESIWHWCDGMVAAGTASSSRICHGSGKSGRCSRKASDVSVQVLSSPCFYCVRHSTLLLSLYRLYLVCIFMRLVHLSILFVERPLIFIISVFLFSLYHSSR